MLSSRQGFCYGTRVLRPVYSHDHAKHHRSCGALCVPRISDLSVVIRGADVARGM